ncbi:MAG: S8 family serine peptidase [Xenococcaceae cyanobacterium MO_207.B15]|nr:S8 family serine peptidase [Xenococcaceae cyanobacterium MO_207.B15]
MNETEFTSSDVLFANDSFDTAIPIEANDFLSDSVNASSDESDYYTFNLSETSIVDLYLYGLSADADLYLYDSSRNPIDSSTAGGFESEFLFQELSAGDYFIEVFAFSGSTDYSLDIFSFPSETIINDDSFDTATPIGTNDFLFDSVNASSDVSDFYTFNLRENSIVDLYLYGLEADADLYLYDSSRNLIDSSTFGGFESEFLSQELSVGDYFIEVEAFSGSTDYSLDIFSFPSGTGIDDNSFDTATPIGANDFLFDSVNASSDVSDFYTFNLRETSIVDLYLYGLSADADLYLYDSSRNEIAFSTAGGFESEFLFQELSAGDYFIEVFAFSGTTDYSLDIFSFPSETIINDDSFDTATLIGANDFLFDSVNASSDVSDFYTFNLRENSIVNLDLYGLSADADLYLYDGDRNQIDSSIFGGIESEFLSQELSAGDYFIEVFAFSGSTDYSLDIFSFPSGTGIDDDDNSFDTATSINANSSRFDSVDAISDVSDFYTFTIRDNTSVEIELSGLSADADLYLYNSSQELIDSSFFGGDTSEYIFFPQLTQGNYFIEVEAFSGSTDYDLQIVSSNNNGDDDNSFDTATSINIGDDPIVQRVDEFTDPNDYYSFNLDTSGTVDIRLTGLSGGDADIELYDAGENYIDGSFFFDSQDELISTSLSSGEYFINVLAYAGEIQYNLSLESEVSGGVPDDNAGNDVNSALPITIGNIYSDWVGPEDTYDYYQLVLDNSANIELELTGLSADADLELLDSSENIISFSVNGGSNDENISELLDPGTYYIRVKPFGNVFTDYSLEISGEEQSIPLEPNPFDSQRGYGFLDASVAVANVLGQAPFPQVDFSGEDSEWAVNMVNAPAVWAQGYTGRGIVVAVLDTGVDRNHPDLSSNIWRNEDEIPGNGLDDDGNGFDDDVWGWNFTRDNNNTLDIDGHGTHVAGTIAGLDNNEGVTGVAYNAQIMPVKVLGDDGRGTTYEGIANGIYYAVDNGANVINMSLSGTNSSQDVQDAIAYAASQGVIVVSAAGNDEESEPAAAPASYALDYGVTVGAVGRSNNFANFSNQAGNDSSMLYVTAPGEDIYSSIPNRRYDSLNGTSMAAPHVAGIAALMLEANPNLSDRRARRIISASTTNSPRSTVLSESDILGAAQITKSSVTEQSFSIVSDPDIGVNNENRNFDPLFNLDIDGDGQIGALSDGIMVVRYMFGDAFSGDALTEGAISPNATRTTDEIRDYLQEATDELALDIDGDIQIGALSDGIMVVRHMFGDAFNGDALIEGAISPDAIYNLDQIQSYLSDLS